jgi:hypothetical protein
MLVPVRSKYLMAWFPASMTAIDPSDSANTPVILANWVAESPPDPMSSIGLSAMRQAVAGIHAGRELSAMPIPALSRVMN